MPKYKCDIKQEFHWEKIHIQLIVHTYQINQ